METVYLLTILVAVTVGSIHAASDEYKKNAQAALAKCMSEQGADADDIKSLKDKELPTTAKGKCVLACMLETAGIINDRKYVPESAYALLDKYVSNEPEKLAAGKKAADDCAKEVEPYNDKDRCELAVKTIDCFRRNAPALDISPQ